MAIYHHILWLQASPKLTSVPAVVRISVTWTLGSGIELNHFNTHTQKKSIFSCSFPLAKAESHDCAVAGPCSQQMLPLSEKSRILGCIFCSQIIFGKERRQRQLARLLERFAGGRAGTGHAGTQQELLSRTQREKGKHYKPNHCYTPSPHCLRNPTVLSSHLPGRNGSVL